MLLLFFWDCSIDIKFLSSTSKTTLEPRVFHHTLYDSENTKQEVVTSLST